MLISLKTFGGRQRLLGGDWRFQFPLIRLLHGPLDQSVIVRVLRFSRFGRDLRREGLVFF